MGSPEWRSIPDPDRLIGQEWIDHGYNATPLTNEAEDCPICGAVSTTCRGDHGGT